MYFKKSYAEQLFQIALALSLFQVDYHTIGRNFNNNNNDSQQFQNYGNRNSWEELQMLHAVPTASFPYANRKAMIPLIEDLIRFDRNSVDLINHNVTAYLLVNSGSSNKTNTNPEQEGAVAVETLQNYNSTSLSVDLDLDLFDEFGTSIFEQNLSDLRDFGEIPILSPLNTYNGLPLKDEPVDYFVDIKLEEDSAAAAAAAAAVPGSSSSIDSGSGGGENPNSNGNSTMFSGSCCDAYNATKNNSIKVEKSDDDDDINSIVVVKQEQSDEGGGGGGEDDEDSEEIEAVDVLWKQDVDLGYSLPTSSDEITKKLDQTVESEEDIEKLKALEELKNDKSKDDDKDVPPIDEWSGINYTIDNETGEYIRLPLQLDEILENLGNLVDDFKEEEEDPISENKEDQSEPIEKEFDDKKEENVCDISPLPSPLFNLDEAVNELDEIDMMIQSHHKNNPQSYGAATPANSAFRQSSFHQPRGPLNRGVSMEQRLQDIANFFNPISSMGMGVGDMPPYSHYSAHYPYQAPHQHSQFTHPAYGGLGELNATQPHYGHNLGSAVTSSMHLTNASHDSADNNSTSGYKLDHDMMYYSNASSEMNHTTEGFINSILNDEDLHLMDMNVTDSNYMRMIDNSGSNTSSLLGCATGSSSAALGATAAGPAGLGMHNSLHASGTLNISNDGSLVPGGTSLSAHGGSGGAADRLDASSDSAVSSMGSERVPSLSDGEWGEGSDSAQDFHHGKYGGPYDYSYNNRLGGDNQQSHRPPVAQKKHQMYGKRFFTEQPPVQHSSGTTPMKYEYDSYNTSRLDSGGGGGAAADIKYSSYADFQGHQQSSLINHNHTYSLPQGSGINPRPQQRDKRTKNKSNSESSSTCESEHLSRDEKRARNLNIPISVSDIINLPMDEFNERLSKYELSEPQLSLIRDIRRRGKNKVAAQNCRKRKLDQIVNLEDEVKEVRQRKAQLYGDRDSLLKEKKRVTAKFQMLHSHIFQYLRDSDGNPCSPNDYTLQQAADGSVYLLRKDLKDAGNMQNHHSKQHKQ